MCRAQAHHASASHGLDSSGVLASPLPLLALVLGGGTLVHADRQGTAADLDKLLGQLRDDQRWESSWLA